MADQDQVLQDVYRLVSDNLANFVNGTPQITAANFDEIIKTVMEVIDTFSTGQLSSLTATRKSELGKEVLKLLVNDLGKRGKIGAESQQFWLTVIDYASPMIFKLVVLADKGLIAINQYIDEIPEKGCFPCGKKEAAVDPHSVNKAKLARLSRAKAAAAAKAKNRV